MTSIADKVEPLADCALSLAGGNAPSALVLLSLTLSYLIALCVHQDEVAGLLKDISKDMPADVQLFQKKLLEVVPHGTHIH